MDRRRIASLTDRPAGRFHSASSRGSLQPELVECVDREVRRTADECYDEALEQLRSNCDRLDRLAVASRDVP